MKTDLISPIGSQSCVFKHLIVWLSALWGLKGSFAPEWQVERIGTLAFTVVINQYQCNVHHMETFLQFFVQRVDCPSSWTTFPFITSKPKGHSVFSLNYWANKTFTWTKQKRSCVLIKGSRVIECHWGGLYIARSKLRAERPITATLVMKRGASRFITG